MKKIVTLFLSLIAGVAICLYYAANFDVKQTAISEDEFIAILSKYDILLQNEFAPLTKQIENKLYGEWKVLDTIGYSLKYNITGGQLDNGFLNISNEKYERTTPGLQGSYTKSYLSPVFMYYSETLGEMAVDELLNYSGIEGLDSETVGMIILGFALSNYSPDNYDLIPTKFIIINDYVIAVHAETFYKLEKGTRE